MRPEQIFRAPTLREGSESLREFAHNAGMDNPDREWLLDPRDAWVKNPYYRGEPGPHPEDDEHYAWTPYTPPPAPPAPAASIDEDIPF